MFIETIKTPGIAHLSYVIGNAGQACVIDPQLDTATYLSIARQNDCRITHIVETHRNEDFISGALALKNKTRAQVYHGENADEKIAYATVVNDGDTFEIGSWQLKVIATPGHTKDSICLAIYDTNQSKTDAIGVFTGDTLFVNDVGRTDFYPDEKEHMAGSLYDSLQKLLQLGDQVVIYPAHGAGSVCGGGMADREFSTIGFEKRNNPVLKVEDKTAFVTRKVSENHYVSPYFSHMENANVAGSNTPISDLVVQPVQQEQKSQWLDATARKGVIVDVREHASFRENHIPGSINLPGGLVSAYGGWLLDYDEPLALVTDSADTATNAAKQLWRMGFTQIEGYITELPAPLTQAEAMTQHINTVTSDTVESRLETPPENWVLLDVRKRDEVELTPFSGAIHTYLGHLKKYKNKFNSNTHYTCMCGSGKRATVAASYLKLLGCSNVDVSTGSLQAWQARH
ncbi:MBL fold metallo-hydrolase [Alteromonas sp. H39]|uniref:MBL fold metallo-hydrolase n=1 Tax=Alteromonas sp. H39 TaxID=3389876 RepID=UPI0039E12FC2